MKVNLRAPCATSQESFYLGIVINCNPDIKIHVLPNWWGINSFFIGQPSATSPLSRCCSAKLWLVLFACLEFWVMDRVVACYWNWQQQRFFIQQQSYPYQANRKLVLLNNCLFNRRGDVIVLVCILYHLISSWMWFLKLHRGIQLRIDLLPSCFGMCFGIFQMSQTHKCLGSLRGHEWRDILRQVTVGNFHPNISVHELITPANHWYKKTLRKPK